MMTNQSVLDRNIVHSFGASGLGSLIEDAYWRFRNKHSEAESERRAWLFGKCAVLIGIACKSSPLICDDAERWRVRIELDDFFRERIHHMETGRESSHELLS